MFMRNVLLLFVLALVSAQASAGDKAADLLKQAGALWQAGKLDEAEQTYKRAVTVNPDSPIAHARLAAFYLSQRRARDAIPQYQEAITLKPRDPRLFVGIAIAYLHQQSYGMAQAMVDRALELDPSLNNARKLGEYVRARQQLVAKAHQAAGEKKK